MIVGVSLGHRSNWPSSERFETLSEYHVSQKWHFSCKKLIVIHPTLAPLVRVMLSVVFVPVSALGIIAFKLRSRFRGVAAVPWCSFDIVFRRSPLTLCFGVFLFFYIFFYVYFYVVIKRFPMTLWFTAVPLIILGFLYSSLVV